MNEVEPVFYTQGDLIERYRGAITHRTLAYWRHSGTGPKFLRLGGKIFYTKVHVDEWEKSKTFSSVHEYNKSCAEPGSLDETNPVLRHLKIVR